MQVFVASDHRGFALKQEIMAYLARNKYKVEDAGDKVLDPKDDYPQFGYALATKVLGSTDDDPRGIALCGGGQGMAIAANRVTGIRAAVITNVEDAEATRIDNDSNVLSLSADRFENNQQECFDIIDKWLMTEFSGAARHQRRIEELDKF